MKRRQKFKSDYTSSFARWAYSVPMFCSQQCSNISGQTSCGGKGEPVCIDGPGHMTKMAVMPIYGKNL